MADAMAEVGNPSSIHAEGRRARDRVERARDQVARLAGRSREEVVFTSGGTEANALGVSMLAGVAERRGLPRIVATTALEHPSLAGAVAALRGWTVALLPVSATGEVTFAGEPPGLVAIAAANHELGTQPALERLAAWAPHALVHVDAVQAIGKAAPPMADALAISAHKLGGPQGVGALVIRASSGSTGAQAREGSIDDLEGEAVAGHQERGRRPGTENLVGIAGFGAAAAVVDRAAWPAVAALGDRLEAGLRALGARIHGDRRIGGTINAGFPGARGESIVIALDLAGIAASTGAACTSGSVKPSPVLLALGQSPDQAREAVRFSLGRTTTADEVDEVLRVLPAILARARSQRA